MNKAFLLAIICNFGFVIVEFVAGFFANSVGLLSDAGHNLGDVVSLALSAFAVILSRFHPTKKYTYGFKKTTILVSLLNAIILLATVVFIFAESINKIFHPEPIQGLSVVVVAAIGVVINGFTAWLFINHQEHDLNVKSAYLHLASDAMVSVGVVIAGIVIWLTHWYIVDALIGIVIALIILYSTWNLLMESINLALNAVPKGIDSDKVEEQMMNVDGVKGIHHIHIWALSTNETALTAHVVIADLCDSEAIKHKLKHILNDMNIAHVTLEFEPVDISCEESSCEEH